MLNKFIFCLSSIFLIFISLLSPDFISASTSYYQDFLTDDSLLDFNILSDSNDPLNGLVEVSTDNVLRLTAPMGRHFPAVAWKNELPVEDFTLEIKFRYPDLRRFGDGIIVARSVPAYDIAATLSDLYFTFWGDTSGIYARYLKNDGLITDPIGSVPGYDWHLSNDWIIMKLVRIDGHNSYYVDNSLLYSDYVSELPKYIYFGNTHFTNTSDQWSTIEIDYIKITDGEGEEPTLPGFYYSQTDPRWGEQEYDQATEWAGGTGTGIGRWGCALTSAAMVLKKNEVKAPDGSELTPLKLNEWLGSEPDGYLRNGYLNWIAVTRLVRTSKLAGQSPTTLEFVREPGTAESIDTRLAESLMPILNLSGHFAVVHSETDPENWGLADPLDETNTSLAKTTAVSSSNLYIPSDTDLAYIMMVADPATKLALLDASGAPKGATYHESLAASSGESAGEINVLYYPKPKSGKYYFEVLSDTTIYLYDGSGNVEISQLLPGHYTIDYDHEKASKSKVKKESFRELVWRLFRAKQINKYAIAYKIATRYNIAQELNRPRTQKTYKRIIKNLGEYISRQNDKQISKNAKDLLLQYLQDN